jgi:hypothetical protein
VNVAPKDEESPRHAKGNNEFVSFEETCELAVKNRKPTRNLMVEEGRRPRSR